MKDRKVRPSVRESLEEDRIQIQEEQKQTRYEPLNMYSFGWLWYTIPTEPEEAGLVIGRTEVVEVYLTSRRAECEFRKECYLLMLKRFNRWRKTKEGRRKLKPLLRMLKKERPGESYEKLLDYAWKDTIRDDMLVGGRFGRIYEDRLIAQRRRLARLSIDPSLLDFQYLSPPVTCSGKGVANWVLAICQPFMQKLTWDELDWARDVLQQVGHLGRMIQAPGFNEDEVKEQVNKLYRLDPPERLESEAELRLFKSAVESFSKSLIEYLESNHRLRKCGHVRCQFGPYFFSKRASKKYCTIYCRDRQASMRYYHGKKTEKEEKTK